jgi:hypothetical protein
MITILLSRGGRIRTYDLLLPKQARYRATLHPENYNLYKTETMNLLLSILRRVRDSNPRYPCEVRQFSKRLLSASQATLLNTFSFSFDTLVVFRLCKGTPFLNKNASRLVKKLELFYDFLVKNTVLI